VAKNKKFYEALIADLDGCLDLARLQWLNAPKSKKKVMMKPIDNMLGQRFSLMRKRDA